MKFIKYICLPLLFIFLGFAQVKAQTVYITEKGKKYHVKSCPQVKPDTKKMELKEAKKNGYKPCTNCKADKIKEEKTSDKNKGEEK